MILEIYITLMIIAFSSFIISIYFYKGFTNVFIWPWTILIFYMLYIASYAIRTGPNNIYQAGGLGWLMLCMAFLSTIIFLYDIYDKFICDVLR